MLNSRIVVALPRDDQKAVLQTLEGIPPLAWASKCKTEDQKYVLHRITRHYKILREEFKAYFSGQESTLTLLEDREREHFELLRGYFLSLYGLLRDAWDAIKEIAARESIDFYPQTPGDALIFILEGRAESWFESCQGYQEASVSKTYQAYRIGTQLQNTGLQQSATEEGKKTIAKYQKAVVSSLGSSTQHLSLEKFCLQACLEASKRSGKSNKSLKRSFRQCNEFVMELRQYYATQLHPSKGSRGGVWDKGVYTQTGARGNVPGGA